MSKKLKPVLGNSIFVGAWVDWNVRDGTGAVERYYCSGVVQDMTGVPYLIMHNEHHRNRPQFFVPDHMNDLSFAVPQPDPPDDECLFHEDIPFWLETKRGKKQ